MKDKIFGVLQRVGRSFMLPIAILPVAGLLLGIGSSFTNETTIATYGLQKILGSGTLLNSLLIIMNKVGSAVFDNLPLIFAVGVAIGMAKKEKEVAALSALIAYFVMNVAVSAMLLINNEITADGQIAADVLEGTITSVCGIQSLQMGVFGGIIVGLGVAALHNRFHKIVLPNALSFFGGSRFIPIISKYRCRQRRQSRLYRQRGPVGPLCARLRKGARRDQRCRLGETLCPARFHAAGLYPRDDQHDLGRAQRTARSHARIRTPLAHTRLLPVARRDGDVRRLGRIAHGRPGRDGQPHAAGPRRGLCRLAGRRKGL